MLEINALGPLAGLRVLASPADKACDDLTANAIKKEFCRLFAGDEHDLLAEGVAARFVTSADFDAFLAQRGAFFVKAEAYGGEWQMRCQPAAVSGRH